MGWDAREPKGGGVYHNHMTMHLEAGGSALLLGVRFSISPKQSSNTLAVVRGRQKEVGTRVEICAQ